MSDDESIADSTSGCVLCPRRCNVDRSLYEGKGLCGMGTVPRVAKMMIHHGEEPCLAHHGGSGTVFFCGCALRCAYCQNASISWDKPHEYGSACDCDKLINIMHTLIMRGAQNINLVNGTPYLPVIIDAIKRWRKMFSTHIPIVWNTSGYETSDAIDSLDGLVDIYLPDLKYSEPDTAYELSKAYDYPNIAQNAILMMREQTGRAIYDSHGAMLRGTIVRHLILPGHIRESMQTLNWLADNLPPGTPVSLMGQFTPCANAALHGLASPLTRASYNLVKNHRLAVGLMDGYNQPPDASGEAMIPVWDLKINSR